MKKTNLLLSNRIDFRTPLRRGATGFAGGLASLLSLTWGLRVLGLLAPLDDPAKAILDVQEAFVWAIIVAALFAVMTKVPVRLATLWTISILFEATMLILNRQALADAHMSGKVLILIGLYAVALPPLTVFFGKTLERLWSERATT